MTFEELEGYYKQLKERVIDSYDYYLNKEILEDFFDGGYENRIDPYDEFLHLEELSDKMAAVLLYSKDLGDKKSREVQIEIIGLKRIVDLKLYESPYRKSHSHMDEWNKKPQKKADRKIKLEFFISNKKEFMEGLRKTLIEINCIEQTSKKEFLDNMLGTNEIKPIKWIETQVLFAEFIDVLHKNKLLDTVSGNRRFKFFSHHFINKKGKRFVPNQITSSQNNHNIKKGSVSEKKFNTIKEYVLKGIKK